LNRAVMNHAHSSRASACRKYNSLPSPPQAPSPLRHTIRAATVVAGANLATKAVPTAPDIA
jgi:hypothetical protein